MLKDDEPKSFNYSFTIKVPNMPPRFIGAFPTKAIPIMLNTIYKYEMPTMNDPEGCPLTVSFKPDMISAFVSFKENQVIIEPT
jgi:hypothetical protein